MVHKKKNPVEASSFARHAIFLDAFEETCLKLLQTSTTNPRQKKKRKLCSAVCSASKRVKKAFDKSCSGGPINSRAAFTRWRALGDIVGVT